MENDASYSPSTGNYLKQGGTVWTIGSGGSLDVITGGKILTSGTQASQITNLVDNSSGSGAAGGTLTAFAVAGAGTVTAAQVAIINNAFTVLAAQIAALNTVIRGIGATA